MRRRAHDDPRMTRPEAGHQVEQLLRPHGEAPLARRQRQRTEPALVVEHRQQRQPDAGAALAAATIRSAISAGSAYGLPSVSWCR